MISNEDFASGIMGELATENDFPALPGEVPAHAMSLDWWKRAHDEQLRLCKELESIADSLPANINRQKCIYAAKALSPLIKGVHHYEETVLFPKIGSLSDSGAGVEDTINRLKFEHFEDECFAEEIAERLLLLGSGRGDINMEATGYMLRGFFEAIRRHVAFEREHLLGKVERLIANADPKGIRNH
jgi:hemerythrin-like domain-containing protein